MPVVLGNGVLRRGQTLLQYIASLNPYVLYNMQQTSGTSEPNSAAGSNSIGSAGNLTLTSVTLGQTGKLGANEAYLMDGANSRMQAANNATLAGLTAWEWVFLVNLNSAGEGNQGAFFWWQSATNVPKMYFGGAGRNLIATVSNSTPALFTTTTSGVLTASSWQIVFCTYDDAGDRKIHIRVGISSTVTELAYSSQPALTGTLLAPTGFPLNLGNRSAQDCTMDGLFDLAFCAPPLSGAARLKLTQMLGV